jgi:hypothetical protein
MWCNSKWWKEPVKQEIHSSFNGFLLTITFIKKLEEDIWVDSERIFEREQFQREYKETIRRYCGRNIGLFQNNSQITLANSIKVPLLVQLEGHKQSPSRHIAMLIGHNRKQ